MWLVKLVATLLTICEMFGVVNRRKEMSEGGIMTSSKVQSAVNADPSSPNVFTISTALTAKDWLPGQSSGAWAFSMLVWFSYSGRTRPELPNSTGALVNVPP